jgi:hypothetical protein
MADACRRQGISSAAFYRWKGEVGGPEVSDAKRLYRSRRRADAAVPTRLRELSANPPTVRLLPPARADASRESEK